jgi:hypothetical protein
MKVNTKFNIGDVFYYIQEGKQEDSVRCPACAGTGKVKLLDGEQHYCPACKGSGEKKLPGVGFTVIGKFSISGVTVREHFSYGGGREIKREITYNFEDRPRLMSYHDNNQKEIVKLVNEGKIFKTEQAAKLAEAAHPYNAVRVD